MSCSKSSFTRERVEGDTLYETLSCLNWFQWLCHSLSSVFPVNPETESTADDFATSRNHVSVVPYI